jgi:hypothetical protein
MPVLPYAWQPGHEQMLLSPIKSKSIKVLGVFKRDNTLQPYMIEGTVNAEIVIACFDDFVPL